MTLNTYNVGGSTDIEFHLINLSKVNKLHYTMSYNSFIIHI